MAVFPIYIEGNTMPEILKHAVSQNEVQRLRKWVKGLTLCLAVLVGFYVLSAVMVRDTINTRYHEGLMKGLAEAEQYKKENGMLNAEIEKVQQMSQEVEAAQHELNKQFEPDRIAVGGLVGINTPVPLMLSKKQLDADSLQYEFYFKGENCTVDVVKNPDPRPEHIVPCVIKKIDCK